MKKFLVFFLIFLLCPQLNSQTKTTSVKKSKINEVTDRYDNENEKWRLGVINFVLKGDDSKLKETIKAMKEFTATTRSYIVFKRKGHGKALALYYRNLENITKLTQLQDSVVGLRKAYSDYTKDFFSKYKIKIDDFKKFELFEKIYEKVMDRWRKEFEDAMKASKKEDIIKIKEDMKILRRAINSFILFPGKFAMKVPQLQKMENDLRHGVVMLKMHEETLTQKNK